MRGAAPDLDWSEARKNAAAGQAEASTRSEPLRRVGEDSDRLRKLE